MIDIKLIHYVDIKLTHYGWLFQLGLYETQWFVGNIQTKFDLWISR